MKFAKRTVLLCGVVSLLGVAAAFSGEKHASALNIVTYGAKSRFQRFQHNGVVAPEGAAGTFGTRTTGPQEALTKVHRG